jgi:hypothetical protein
VRSHVRTPADNYPWQPTDDEPPPPIRGVPGGWVELWELADRWDEARWRADAEAGERERRAVLATEREAPGP